MQEVAALRDEGPVDAAFPHATEATLIAWTDAVEGPGTPPYTLGKELSVHFSEPEIVELDLTGRTHPPPLTGHRPRCLGLPWGDPARPSVCARSTRSGPWPPVPATPDVGPRERGPAAARPGPAACGSTMPLRRRPGSTSCSCIEARSDLARAGVDRGGRGDRSWVPSISDDSTASRPTSMARAHGGSFVAPFIERRSGPVRVMAAGDQHAGVEQG